jgi:hypothetical protein
VSTLRLKLIFLKPRPPPSSRTMTDVRAGDQFRVHPVASRVASILFATAAVSTTVSGLSVIGVYSLIRRHTVRPRRSAPYGHRRVRA